MVRWCLTMSSAVTSKHIPLKLNRNLPKQKPRQKAYSWRQWKTQINRQRRKRSPSRKIQDLTPRNYQSTSKSTLWTNLRINYPYRHWFQVSWSKLFQGSTKNSRMSFIIWSSRESLKSRRAPAIIIHLTRIRTLDSPLFSSFSLFRLRARPKRIKVNPALLKDPSEKEAAIHLFQAKSPAFNCGIKASLNWKVLVAKTETNLPWSFPKNPSARTKRSSV